MAREVMVSTRVPMQGSINEIYNHGGPRPPLAPKTGGNQPLPPGNFKGVMLCNRPGIAQVKPAGSQDPPPFKAGGSAMAERIAEHIGLCPPREKLKLHELSSLRPQAQKKRSWMTRHKMYLKELAKYKGQAAREEAEYEKMKQEERLERFRQYSKKMRDAIRNAKDLASKGEITEEEKGKSVQSALKGTSTKGKTGKSKPAWALTEEQHEEKEEEEVDQLVDFANNLDYDKYMEDMDVQDAVNKVMERVDELRETEKITKKVMADPEWKQRFAEEWNKLEDDEAGEEGYDDEAQGDAAQEDAVSVVGSTRSMTSSARRRKGQMMKDENDGGQPQWDTSTNPDKASVISRESQRAARELREMNPKLRNVHSEHSVRTMLEKNKGKWVKNDATGAIEERFEGNAKSPRAPSQHRASTAENGENRASVGGGAGLGLTNANIEAGTVPQPPVRIAIINTSEVRRQQKKEKEADPSNLPYLYRNPAI